MILVSRSPSPRAGDQRALIDPGALTKMVQAIAAHAVPERGEAFTSVLSTASSPAVEPDLATPNPNASRRGELHQAETDDRVVDQPPPWPAGFYARFDLKGSITRIALRPPTGTHGSALPGRPAGEPGRLDPRGRCSVGPTASSDGAPCAVSPPCSDRRKSGARARGVDDRRSGCGLGTRSARSARTALQTRSPEVPGSVLGCSGRPPFGTPRRTAARSSLLRVDRGWWKWRGSRSTRQA